MRVIDISRPMLAAPLYPGDPSPYIERISATDAGDDFNTGVLHASLHAGTHLDAPLHAVPEGTDAASLAPDVFLGECAVADFAGEMDGEQAEALLASLGKVQRLLLRGGGTLSPYAAYVLADAGLCLVGVEGVSVSSAPYDEQVHRILLSAGVALLEGLDLSQAAAGRYLLIAAPLRIEGAEASPVRAMLLQRQGIDWDENTWRR